MRARHKPEVEGKRRTRGEDMTELQDPEFSVPLELASAASRRIDDNMNVVLAFCKQLLRPATGEAFYKEENAAMRKGAQRMSPIRDSHVRVQTIEKLTVKSGKRRAPAAFARIRTAMRLVLAK